MIEDDNGDNDDDDDDDDNDDGASKGCLLKRAKAMFALDFEFTTAAGTGLSCPE